MEFQWFWRRARLEDIWGAMSFSGARLTLFHWSHNERIYLGRLDGRWAWRTVPFGLMRSLAMRRKA